MQGWTSGGAVYWPLSQKVSLIDTTKARSVKLRSSNTIFVCISIERLFSGVLPSKRLQVVFHFWNGPSTQFINANDAHFYSLTLIMLMICFYTKEWWAYVVSVYHLILFLKAYHTSVLALKGVFFFFFFCYKNKRPLEKHIILLSKGITFLAIKNILVYSDQNFSKSIMSSKHFKTRLKTAKTCQYVSTCIHFKSSLSSKRDLFVNRYKCHFKWRHILNLLRRK